MIRLSIVMPSNRDNLTAISRIARACSWAGPEIEVIVRDNSGSASKRRLLKEFEGKNCHIFTCDPCRVHENFFGAFDQAKGDFVMFTCDDDICFDRAIAALPEKIEGVMDDASVAGIIGSTVVHGTRWFSITPGSNFDADNAPERMSQVLRTVDMIPLVYSPVRRSVMELSIKTLREKPIRFSFDDQLGASLYVLQGKFVPLDRLLYCWDPSQWESYGNEQREDLKHYLAAALDPAINKLHWLFCAFEGAVLIRNLEPLSNYTLAQRQDMADRWFARKFIVFQESKREDLGSAFAADAEKLCVKWKAAAGQLSFGAILADICQFLALFSVDEAMKYFAFWGKLLGLQQASAA